MANKTKGFVVASARRSSGVAYWLVRGSLGGKQIRKEFADRTEALQFQEQRNSELFGAPDVRQVNVLTRLPTSQVREAEVAIARLEHDFPGASLHEVVDYYCSAAPQLSAEDIQRFGTTLNRLKEKYPDASLADVCDFFLETFKPDTSGVTVGSAMDSYVADVERRFETGALSWWQRQSIKFATQKFERHFGSETRLAHFTASQLHDYLVETSRAKDGSRNYSNKTWTNRRGYLTRFFSFCVEEGWLERNPALQVRKYTKREHAQPAPKILRAEEARKLMEAAENFAGGRLVPYLVLTLFCGIRPTAKKGEVGKLNPEQINLARGEIHLQRHQTKTHKPRVIKLQPNVVSWLQTYPPSEWPIICRNFRKVLATFRSQNPWGYDVLRHTFASMLVGRTRSVADAALQAGNTENVIWGNYLNLVSKNEAASFWRILPRRLAGLNQTAPAGTQRSSFSSAAAAAANLT